MGGKIHSQNVCIHILYVCVIFVCYNTIWPSQGNWVSYHYNLSCVVERSNSLFPTVFALDLKAQTYTFDTSEWCLN